MATACGELLSPRTGSALTLDTWEIAVIPMKSAQEIEKRGFDTATTIGL
jgi:hypothetical protein